MYIKLWKTNILKFLYLYFMNATVSNGSEFVWCKDICVLSVWRTYNDSNKLVSTSYDSYILLLVVTLWSMQTYFANTLCFYCSIFHLLGCNSSLILSMILDRYIPQSHTAHKTERTMHWLNKNIDNIFFKSTAIIFLKYDGYHNKWRWFWCMYPVKLYQNLLLKMMTRRTKSNQVLDI